MELNGLKVFLSVAARGSVSAAARDLHYVQSNITAHIKKLEQELEVSLFVRQHRGMVLTAAGQILRDYAERLLRLEVQAREAVRDSNQHGGVLRLGSMETTMAIRLPPLLKTLRQDFPQADIRITTGTTRQLVDEVLNYQLDCALIAGELEHPALQTVPAFTEELVIIRPVHADQQAQQTLLVFRPGCHYRARAEQWLRDQGVLPVSIMEFGALEGILGCVDAGLGCTLLPRSVVQQRGLLTDTRIETLPDEALVTTRLIWRRDTPPPKLLSALRERLASAPA